MRQVNSLAIIFTMCFEPMRRLYDSTSLQQDRHQVILRVPANLDTLQLNSEDLRIVALGHLEDCSKSCCFSNPFESMLQLNSEDLKSVALGHLED